MQSDKRLLSISLKSQRSIWKCSFSLWTYDGVLILRLVAVVTDKLCQPGCKSDWENFVFCKAVLGFILLTVPWPNPLLGECHISCSGVVCSSCSWLHWASTISSLKYNQPVWFSYQGHFLCFTESSWFFFFAPHFESIVFLGRKQKFLELLHCWQMSTF